MCGANRFGIWSVETIRVEFATQLPFDIAKVIRCSNCREVKARKILNIPKFFNKDKLIKLMNENKETFSFFWYEILKGESDKRFIPLQNENMAQYNKRMSEIYSEIKQEEINNPEFKGLF